MIAARPYAPGDARLIEAQAGQAVEARLLTRELLRARPPGPAYTIVRDDAPIACGGLIPLWEGFATAWGFAQPLDRLSARVIVRQFGKALRALSVLGPVRRLEATARCDFPAAQAFLETLGFERVVRLERYGPDGGDYWLYAWLAPPPEEFGQQQGARA